MGASFLDQESQLLLSLSCRRLRALLNSHLDLMLNDDRPTKVRFPQLLELDHPVYLTCRSCGLLYPWRKMDFFQYDCPRAFVGIVDKIWQNFEQAVTSMIVGSEKFEVFKCSFCETGHQVHVKKGEGVRTRIVLNV
ncbi:uncharacterized protein A1O5_01726 [Cladophialophora psammophila CBS 110553]|uniref:Uncharacterized protein n=1 Tax=Cladophialophora psammophila CBS 110553 TaxID=1182543 RepID=W9XCJ1_9EURO|nr:uncharacterized protein A1O5_01726 [Cladophialophora psammophila CBS 110553]EXJ75030.1 hypothetical protein A1O5_01726 [Cladophialophora psammophila CBS 110553]